MEDAPQDRIERAVAAVKQQPWYIKYSIILVLFAIPLIAIAMARPRLVAYAESRSAAWLAHARHLDAPADSPSLRHPANIDTVVQERLDTQLKDLRSAAYYHLTVARSMFGSQYMVVTIAAVAAVIAGVILVPISWKGWKSAPPYLTVPFLVIAGIAVLFATFNQVYQQNENVTNSTTAYFGYLALEDEMLSYYPRRSRDSASVIGPGAFIHHMDQQVKALRTFAIGFDPSRIPTISGVQEQIEAGVPRER